MKQLIYTAMAMLVCGAVFAQTGSVGGSIHDEQTGEEIVGANVLVVDTKLGGVTDMDGKYLIRNIPAGTYTLRVSYVGYTTKLITGVVIGANETGKVDLTIAAATLETDEVTITAERVRSTEAALLSERKKAAAIGDAISAEQIKRTPDATSGDALKRVTGISIVDNKFVYIRGITDRYNGTTLDGAAVASTESGKKGFSFDLLPANLIENTTVVKSATPDLPGDFTGGLVQLNTLDFPDHQLIKINLASAFNSLTSTKGVLVSQGSRGFLGFDDGGRDFPGENPDPTRLAQSLSNTWAPRNTTAPLNNSFSLALGDRLIFDEENPSAGQLGFIGAASYRSTYQRNQRTISDRDLHRFTVGPRDEFNVLWGAMANVSYKLSGLHKISFKNSYNHSAADEASQVLMRDNNNGLDNTFTTIAYTQRSVYTGQLVGDHTLPEFGGLTVQWRGSVSSSARQDPDRKEVNYYRSLDDPTQPYTVGYNKRSWSRLNDRTMGGSLDFSLPVLEGKLKFGAATEGKTTGYEIRYFKGEPDYFGGNPDSIIHLSLDKIYEPQNFGSGKIRFNEITTSSDFYAGDQSLYSGYLMVDQPFVMGEARFRLIGGARLENYRQTVGIPKSRFPGKSGVYYELKKIDLLPSVNLTYLMTDDMNLRFAYSHSVNRPEFRERAEVIYEDFVKNELVSGNPHLGRAFVHNYDVRYEFFPSVGEVVAISFFEKRISGAIEERLQQDIGTRTRTYFNSGFTRNLGWEFEFRKTLGFLGAYWNNLLITGNYTRVESRVEYTRDVVGAGGSASTSTILATRPMQGQSPYMINLSIQFTEPDLGTSFSILYNRFGSRVNTVGSQSSNSAVTTSMDIYEEPRDIVDLALTQPLFGGLEGKFTIRNLNGKDRVLTRDGYLYERTSTGVTYGLQLSLSM